MKTKEEFKRQYNPYGHLGGYTNFSKDLNDVIKDELEKFVLYLGNQQYDVDMETIVATYLNQKL